MEQTAFQIMREAMEILKKNHPEMAYAKMSGYAIAGITDVEMAKRILELVKKDK
jgi:hypothetical protein